MKKNCIYGICNKDGRAILYNEGTNQYITSTKTVNIPQTLIRKVTVLLTPITMGISYYINPIWMNLLNSNVFKVFIAIFLFAYICLLYFLSRKFYNKLYEKHYFVIEEKDFELTIDDIKNGEKNFKETNKWLFSFVFFTLMAFALFLVFRKFILFFILLATLFCSVALYALLLPQKRKKFYENYRKKHQSSC